MWMFELVIIWSPFTLGRIFIHTWANYEPPFSIIHASIFQKQNLIFLLAEAKSGILHLEISEQLINTVIDQRIEFNELNTKISDYIEWQDLEEGRKSSIPKIKETFKDISFTDWDAQVKQAELAIARSTGISKNMVKMINHMLHTSGLIKEGNHKSIPDIINLEQSWKNACQLREETLAQLKKTDWESYW